MSRVRRRIRPSDRPVAVLLAGVVTLFGSSISNWFANRTNSIASLD